MLGKCCLAERVDRMAVGSWRIQRIKALLAAQPWRVAFIVRAAQIPIAVKNATVMVSKNSDIGLNLDQ